MGSNRADLNGEGFYRAGPRWVASDPREIGSVSSDCGGSAIIHKRHSTSAPKRVYITIIIVSKGEILTFSNFLHIQISSGVKALPGNCLAGQSIRWDLLRGKVSGSNHSGRDPPIYKLKDGDSIDTFLN